MCTLVLRVSSSIPHPRSGRERPSSRALWATVLTFGVPDALRGRGTRFSVVLQSLASFLSPLPSVLLPRFHGCLPWGRQEPALSCWQPAADRCSPECPGRSRGEDTLSAHEAATTGQPGAGRRTPMFPSTRTRRPGGSRW